MICVSGDPTDFSRPLAVLKRATPLRTLEVIPLLAGVFVDSAEITPNIPQSSIACGTDERGRRFGRMRRLHTLVRAPQRHAGRGGLRPGVRLVRCDHVSRSPKWPT